MSFPAAEIEHLLYEDEDGDAIGLHEVQLLEPVPHERVPKLRALLTSEDVFLRFQAAKVLAAWGEPKGLEAIETLIDMRVHEQHELAPHRMNGYDNVYDELAEAVGFFVLSSDALPDVRLRLFRKLLGLYGPCPYDGGLAHALEKSDFQELVPDVKTAIERAETHDDPLLASQLLPPLARWEPAAAWALVPRYLKGPDVRTAGYVAAALVHLESRKARRIISRLARHDDPFVSHMAQQAMKDMGTHTVWSWLTPWRRYSGK